MVLAAGLGTRLRPLTEHLPKPMLTVLDLPLLRFALHHLEKAGVPRTAVNLHHLPDPIVEELESAPPPMEVVFSHEQDRILGTGGGIGRMADLLCAERYLVVNGDCVVELDPAALLDHHRRSGARATMLLAPHPGNDFTSLVLDTDGTVQRIGRWERPGAKEGIPCIFTGVHVLESEVIGLLPHGPSCVVGTAYRQLLTGGERVAGLLNLGYHCDAGTPGRLLEANLELLAMGRTSAFPLTGCGAKTLVSPGAEVEAGARLGPGTVVGRGARIRSGADLERCVVLAGATASGRIRDAIVTPFGGAEVVNSE